MYGAQGGGWIIQSGLNIKVHGASAGLKDTHTPEPEPRSPVSVLLEQRRGLILTQTVLKLFSLPTIECERVESGDSTLRS